MRVTHFLWHDNGDWWPGLSYLHEVKGHHEDIKSTRKIEEVACKRCRKIFMANLQ